MYDNHNTMIGKGEMEVNYLKFLHYKWSDIISLEGRCDKRMHAINPKAVMKITKPLPLISQQRRQDGIKNFN